MKYLLLLICILSIAATCNDATTKNPENISDDRLNGRWTMVSYSAFLPGIPTLEMGDIIWTINAKKSEISVAMKDEKKTNNLGFEPGVYSYEIKMDKIIIDNRDFAYSIAEDGILKLDKNTDPRLSKDQPVMRFKRTKQIPGLKKATRSSQSFDKNQ